MSVLRITRALLIFSIFFATHTALAEDMPCVMRVDRTKVAPGKQVQLEIELPASAGPEAPEIPFIDGVDIQFVRSSQRDKGVTGEKQPPNVFQYKAVPRRPGRFTIGPLTFQRGSDTYRTQSVVLTVEKEDVRAAQVDKPGLSDLTGRIYVEMDMPKTEIYLNEKIPAYLKLFTDWIDLEDITFSQKSSEELIVKDFKDKTVELTQKGATRFALLKYSSSLYAVTEGSFILEPVSVKFNIVMPHKDSEGKTPEPINDNASFYEALIGGSYSQPVELITKPVDIKVLRIPEKDRPDSFRGAVGRFRFELQSVRDSVKFGESVRMTARITGDGNFDAIAPPVADNPSGINLAVLKTTKGPDEVAYEMQMTIRSKDIKALPSLLFSYFDPVEKNYVTLSRNMPLKYEPSIGAEDETAGPAQKIAASKSPGERILSIKTVGRDLRRKGPNVVHRMDYRTALIAPFILIVMAIFYDRRRAYLDRHPSYAALLRAKRAYRVAMAGAAKHLDAGDPGLFYGELFLAMQKYLGQRVSVPSEGVSGRTIDEYFGGKIDSDLVVRLKKLFAECYMARYSSGKKDRHSMKTALNEIGDIVGKLNITDITVNNGE